MTKRPLKVAVVGTHGTGKTTLCDGLSEALRDAGVSVAVIAEVPRRICLQTGDPEFFHRRNNSVLRQLALLLIQIVDEARAPNSSSVVLSDRSVLDHWAYTACLFRPQLVATSLEPILRETVVEHCRTYDLLLYLPPEIDLVVDEVRESDIDFRSEVDREIVEMLNACGFPFEALSGSIDFRLRAAMKHISDLREGS